MHTDNTANFRELRSGATNREFLNYSTWPGRDTHTMNPPYSPHPTPNTDRTLHQRQVLHTQLTSELIAWDADARL